MRDLAWYDYTTCSAIPAAQGCTYRISFSGGIGSAVSALLALEHGLIFQCVFADTLIEDEDLHRFADDIERAIGQPIVRLCDGRTPWEVFADRRFHGNSRTAHCSQELKTRVVRAYLDEHAEPGDPLVLGMDITEGDRLARAAANWSPRPVVSLLDALDVRRGEHAAILKRHNIAPPPALWSRLCPQ